MDGAVGDEDLAQRVGAAVGEELGASAPHGREGVVAAVAEVEGDGGGGLDEAGPERVVRRMAERPGGAVLARHRRGAQVHDPGAGGEHAVELDHRGLGVGQREHRGADDPTLVVEAPVLVEPRVEGRQRGHGGVDVVLESLFDAAPHGGEQHDRGEVLVVHDLQPGVTVLVLGPERLDLHERPRIDSLGDLAPEEGVDAARHDDGVEGRVRDELVGVATGQHPRAPAGGDDLHAAAGEGRVEVPGEGVERLVVVVVGVDRLVVQVHGQASLGNALSDLHLGAAGAGGEVSLSGLVR